MNRTHLSPPVLVLMLGLGGWLATAPPAPAQPTALLFSLAAPNEARSGHFRPIEPADVLRFEPDLSLETHPFLSRQNLEVLVGDVNANREFDDAPGNIDALFPLTGSRRPSAYDLVFSFAAASTRLPGGTARDGDLVRLAPGGAFQVFASEAVLSSVTGTRTIDVDAAAVTALGELVFSFTEDEVTTNTTLIQQNGGSNKLGDETILGWKPGTTQVRIVHTKDAVIRMVARATGKKLTSVVDLVGLAPDPRNAGSLLFTVASRAKGLAGAVFTTAAAGAYARVNGKVLDGADQWGLKTPPTIDALGLYRGGKDPLALEVIGERLVTPGKAAAEIHVHGGLPGGTVQLFATYATRPAPRPYGLGVPLNGVPFGYPTPGDPLLLASSRSPALQASINSEGRGTVRLALGPLPPGESFLLQGVDLSAYEVSEPVVIDLVRQ